MKRLTTGIALVLGALVTGCGSTYSVDIDLTSQPPLAVSIRQGAIDTNEGLAFTLVLTPLEDDEPMDAEDVSVRVESLDEDIVSATWIDLTYDDWILWGEPDDSYASWPGLIEAHRAGLATLLVTIDDRHEVEVPIDVAPQPPVDE